MRWYIIKINGMYVSNSNADGTVLNYAHKREAGAQYTLPRVQAILQWSDNSGTLINFAIERVPS